jgi:hypothetical protein
MKKSRWILTNQCDRSRHWGFTVKKSRWILAIAIVTTGSLVGWSSYKIFAAPEAPKPLAHTLEYDAVVAEHIDLTKVARAEIDLTTVKQELSPHLAVYRFRHPQLRGKWGYLNVFVDRDKSITMPRSLWDVDGQPPKIIAGGNCLLVAQAKLGVVDNYEVCAL